MRQVKMETLDLEEAYLQTIFSLADTNITDLIMACYQSGSNIKKWATLAKRQFKDIVTTMLDTIQQQSFGQRPWKFINQGFSPQILANEYQLAKDARAGLHCEPSCRACGICDDFDEE